MGSYLNDNQKRHLLLTLEHVDRLLSDALDVLSSSESSSPFQRYVPDAPPAQRKIIADHVAHLREIMARVIERQEITPPKPKVSALWSYQAAVLLAKEAIEELAPKYMRGYGPLSHDASNELKTLTARIIDVLDHMIDPWEDEK